MTDQPNAAERLLLLYSDGSAGVLPAGAQIDQALKEAADADVNEFDPAKMTRIFLAKIELLDEIPRPDVTPAPAPVCPNCGAKLGFAAQ